MAREGIMIKTRNTENWVHLIFEIKNELINLHLMFGLKQSAELKYLDVGVSKHYFGKEQQAYIFQITTNDFFL